MVQIPLRVPSYLPVRAERPNTLERVYAVGTPLRESLRSTVTTGVVSAIRTDGRTGLSRIQADVAISPGNSGGPLLDENGNVIGIAVAGYSKASSEGLNLFIPIGDALEAVNLKMGRGPS
jgi:S1-C subfamily serine protease